MDIPVLKYVDILIGLSLVMVLVSTVVLAITQAVLNSTFARARHLQRGLRRLIVQVEPASIRAHAPYLAALFVRHPMIGQQTMFTPWRRLFDARRAKRAAGRNEEIERLPPISPGSVVQREELAYLMIEFAAGEGPLMDPVDTGETPKKITEAQSALAQALRSAGIEDAAATLRAIRLKVLENERANPDQPSNRWRAEAVTDCATSDFIGKLHATFDNTMARVTDGFMAESKLWVSAVALLVAVALQLDSIELVKRLSIGSAYRDGLVQVAETLQAQNDKIGKSDPAQAASNEEGIKRARESLALLGSPAIDLLPRTVPLVGTRAARDRLWNHLPGIVFSWLLLSLGAPFWFDALKNLLKLRSLLAKKDDKDREQRETTQRPPPSRTPASAAPGTTADAAGEAGDLSATGAAG